MTVQITVTSPTPIIAICNHKGGSGKTTTAWHLAQALNCTEPGHLRRALLVDLDDQATLTNRLAHQAVTIGSPIETQPTIADALDGAPTTIYHYTPSSTTSRPTTGCRGSPPKCRPAAPTTSTWRAPCVTSNRSTTSSWTARHPPASS